MRVLHDSTISPRIFQCFFPQQRLLFFALMTNIHSFMPCKYIFLNSEFYLVEPSNRVVSAMFFYFFEFFEPL